MIEIIDKEHCTGCGACLSSCPKSSITMQMDKEGFEFPIINQDTCINCVLCQKVCPPLHYDERSDKRLEENTIQKGFAARNKNYDERIVSSSGSIFAVFAHQILQEGGYVVGVAYNKNYNAVYRIIDNVKYLPLIQGSKYLQCKPDKDIFQLIKQKLQTGNKVLFSGLACQCEGIRAYLCKDYDNLICVDLICMGVPSPFVWQKYLSTYFKGEKINQINFKEKSVGWDHFNLAINTDKKDFKQWGMVNPYFKSMFNTYNMRRSCFVCPFKKLERAADITLADCWGASKLVPEINDNKGLSSVFVHSSKGYDLWKSIEPMVDQKALPIEVLVEGNTNMIQNRTCDLDNRSKFYNLLNSRNPKKAFEFAAKQGAYVQLNIVQRAIHKIKRIFS